MRWFLHAGLECRKGTIMGENGRREISNFLQTSDLRPLILRQTVLLLLLKIFFMISASSSRIAFVRYSACI